MMKKYVIPKNLAVELEEQELVADSPQLGVSNGNKLGNARALSDNDENFFAKEQSGSVWDEEW